MLHPPARDHHAPTLLLLLEHTLARAFPWQILLMAARPVEAKEAPRRPRTGLRPVSCKDAAQVIREVGGKELTYAWRSLPRWVQKPLKHSRF